ncbi:MAG TPA: hypothetical protein VFN03_08680 [Trueperaceae bacterium]|nr:hypothetical protein [Trueperaceae bacterium]
MASAAVPLTLNSTLRQWWPLAAGWLLMTAELTVFTALVARMPAPEVQLAAWGIIFALSTLVQSPSTALLPTSTAMARDRVTFRTLTRYAWVVIGVLTAVHALIALTPLYGVIVTGVMGVPAEAAAQARPALLMMLPWTFGTGMRRFLQGVMIRFGHARIVILGSAMRLGVGTTIMVLGAVGDWLPGAQLAAVAIIAGVLTEVAYTRFRFTAVLREKLPATVDQRRTLTFRRFFAFFAPLVLTTVLTMVVQTLVTVVLGRMPLPLESLAVWPVLLSLLVILQSPGMAFTEVVISLLERPGAVPLLRRVTWVAVAVLSVALIAVAGTPLAHGWFQYVSALSPELTELAVMGLWLGLAVPGLRLLTSWYQGAIIYGERTRGILESVLVFLVTAALVLGAGVMWGGMIGVYVGMIGMTAALATQAAWLAHRAAPVLRATVTAVPVGA